jgi:LysR family hydrogen peroxide-inducible transcriptional activator
VRQLCHLVALADHAHFGHAAAACHVTQSTLSASIKELEALLDAGLVDRTKRSVVLTPLGLETVNRARKIIAEMEELAGAARALREPLSGMVRMGVISTVGPYLLPRVLPGLRRAYGQLKLYLVEDLTERLIEALHHGKLDVVLLALPCDCGAVETSMLFEDSFVVALPKGHALSNEAQITPEQLSCEDLLLLKDGHCLREHALAACGLAGRRPRRRPQEYKPARQACGTYPFPARIDIAATRPRSPSCQ